MLLWVYYTTPFGLSLIWHFQDITFHVLNYFVWLRITDEDSVPEMRIWPILLIKSDLKRCIHLSRSLCSYIKPQSDIHCNLSATSPRPKFKTIAEVAEELQLGFAVGRGLVGDWSPTNRRLVADWSATGRRPRGDLFATWWNWSPTGRGPVPD